MTGPSLSGMLTALIEQVSMEQRQEVARAVAFRGNNDLVRAAYHTGLADGRNGIISALKAILNSSSINKRGNANGRQ